MADNKKVSDTKEAKTNGLAIAGFVCSFVAQIVGLVLSIIGLVQIKKSGEKGRGLAIAGIIISAVGIFLTILIIIGSFIFSFWLVDRAIDTDWSDWDWQGCGYGHGYHRAASDADIPAWCR